MLIGGLLLQALTVNPAASITLVVVLFMGGLTDRGLTGKGEDYDGNGR